MRTENLDSSSARPLYLAVPCSSSATVYGGFFEEFWLFKVKVKGHIFNERRLWRFFSAFEGGFSAFFALRPDGRECPFSALEHSQL